MADSWVSEVNAGFGLTFKVKETLYSGRSEFQQIDIYETINLGRLLMLDGIVQLCNFDEFAYHEMMVNLPFYAHLGAPERALVIGGGDGGCLRELGRHLELQTIDICEIDAKVIELCRKFLPFTACGFDDPRVKINLADGSKFIAQHPGYYDIIIVDSTDPGGPGKPLFGDEFYANLKLALRPGGVICTQSESPWLLPDTVQDLQAKVHRHFKYAGYAAIQVPTYPTGMIGASVASDGRPVTTPDRPVSSELSKIYRYYTPEVHTASFACNPAFARKLF